MKAEVIKLFKSHGDGGERSIGPVIAYSTNRRDAELQAQGRGWYGGNGSVTEGWGLRLPTGEVFALETPEQLDLDGSLARAKEKARQDALAKLTPADRKILGL